MNKQELIEKAVLAFDGKWLFPFSNLCTPALSNTAFAPYSKFESIRNVNDLSQHWDFVCTCQEFEVSAKRMGYINGYRWGVEYPTNGNQPKLTDDVIVSTKCNDNRGWLPETICFNRDWRWPTHFKITDPRYKPADTSYLNSQPKDHIVEANEMVSDWHERGELPPIGEKCEWSTNDGKVWSVTKLIFKDDHVFLTKHYELYKVADLNVKFRPIRTEREKFIEAATSAAIIGDDKSVKLNPCITAAFERLFAAGFRGPKVEK